VDISADGKFLAVTKGNGATQFFDVEQKKPVAVFASPGDWLDWLGDVAISPDGRFMVQGTQEGIRVWNVPSSAAIAESNRETNRNN
jgi:WD40 repeat protein